MSSQESQVSSVIEVLALGTPILVDGDIPATIRGITIYSPHWIKYFCSWWDERSLREEWLSPDYFRLAEDKPKTFCIVQK